MSRAGDKARRLGFLASLDDADRDELQQLGERRRIPSGEVVLREGDTSDYVLLIVSGRVRIVTSGHGGDVSVGERGAGDLLGELAAIAGDGRGRVASAIADEPLEVREISGEEFRDFVASRPTVSLMLVRAITSRLRTDARVQAEFGEPHR